MKRIALLTAALTLAAGAAMAATPSQPVAQHHQKAKVVQISASDRETQALNLLEAKGYGSFTNFQPAGKDYTATVTHDGHAMNVRVDPISGMVTTQS
jgi:hypothetical protein